MNPYSLPGGANEALTDLLVDVSAHMQSFGQERPGYGIEANLDREDLTFRMRPFCWCEEEECPWCTGHLCAEEGYSNHQILRLEPIFEAAGFETGEGAPNFWFDNGEISIKVWWYKYIGRGMRASRRISVEEVKLLRTAIFKALETREVDILRASLAAELDPRLHNCDSALLQTMQNAFLAMILSAPHGETREAAKEQVLQAIHAFTRQSYFANQAHKATGILDEAGVKRIENPEDPEDLHMEFSLTHRVECLVKGHSPQGEEIPF